LEEDDDSLMARHQTIGLHGRQRGGKTERQRSRDRGKWKGKGKSKGEPVGLGMERSVGAKVFV